MHVKGSCDFWLDDHTIDWFFISDDLTIINIVVRIFKTNYLAFGYIYLCVYGNL